MRNNIAMNQILKKIQIKDVGIHKLSKLPSWAFPKEGMKRVVVIPYL